MKTKHSFGFTLVEVLISVTIVALISGMLLLGIIQLGESADKTKTFVKTRKQLSTFTQGIYNFINKSVGLYFLNGAAEEVNYTTSYPNPIGPGNAILDTLYLVKDSAGTLGTVVYNPTAHTLTYFETPNTPPGAVMLTDVYRMDYVSDVLEADPDLSKRSKAPIFRFPHNASLYKEGASTRPLFVIIEFRRRIAAPTSATPIAPTVPVKLICKVAVLT
jgi:prepilin-type N-terminal cleavage/methylation domain-containing protein